MLKAKGMPNNFWVEAVTCAIYLINRSPTWSVPNTTPIKAWSGFKPNVQHLRYLGQLLMLMSPRQQDQSWMIR